MQKIGSQTIKFDNPPTILDTACIVGPKEADGPLAKYFDQCLDDEFWGEKSWEKAESKIIKETVNTALTKSKLASDTIDFCFAGDLLNQCISSSFGLRYSNIPFFGIFGACSTYVEGMGMAASFIDGGAATNALCAASSHFCSAEKQFRFPLELGNQRPPTAQWTVTGAGSVLIAPNKEGPKVKYVTVGKVIDEGIDDGNNMGPAMAPAAVDTIYSYFNDTKDDPNSFDLIITGDLGKIGKQITEDFLKKKGIDISNVYTDCGLKIFNLEEQDVHCGGSGCGCSATVFAGYIYQKLLKKEFNKVMLVSTGALLSPTSTLQKQTIPCIAHAVVIESE